MRYNCSIPVSLFIARGLVGFVLGMAVTASSYASQEVSTEAKTRAVLYQTEVRTALSKKQWHVAAERPGIIVADHILYQTVASSRPQGSSGYTRAVIAFKPKSVTDTRCTTHVSEHINGLPDKSGILFHDPTTFKDLEGIINDARKQLLAIHPEFAPLSKH